MNQNLIYYYFTTLLLALLMIAMSIHVLSYSGFNKKQKTWFVVTFAAITFCALAELAIHWTQYHNPSAIVPLTILTVLQFATAPCFAMLFAGALGLKHQLKAALICFGICITIGIVCAPNGWVFYFDSNFEYQRGTYFYIYIITYIASLIYMIGALVLVGRRFRVRDIGTIIMVLVVLAGGIIPMTIKNLQIHLAYTSVGIAAALCYVYYNDLVQQDTRAELMDKQHKINEMQVHIISGLANLIESRDIDTGMHVARTSAYAKVLAICARDDDVYTDVLTDHYIDLLFTLAPMHDVGKILVSDTILRKPGKLTPEEFEEIKKHAELGGMVVRQILAEITDEEYVSFACDIATYHHEKWNGFGYPKGLKGEEIPLNARIMAFADVFDALVSKRCYKEPIPVEEAFKIIEKDAGTHFDPKLAKVFLNHKDVFIEINATIVEKD